MSTGVPADVCQRVFAVAGVLAVPDVLAIADVPDIAFVVETSEKMFTSVVVMDKKSVVILKILHSNQK